MEMEWGYPTGSKKAHCFKTMENPDLKVSLCGQVVTFNVGEIREEYESFVNICFNCLLMYVRRGEEKP